MELTINDMYAMSEKELFDVLYGLVAMAEDASAGYWAPHFDFDAKATKKDKLATLIRGMMYVNNNLMSKN